MPGAGRERRRDDDPSEARERPPPLVLLADDNDRFRRLVRSILAQAGIEVIEAASGAEALEKAAEVDPDVVLLDWRMPGGGLLTAARLVADHGMAGRVVMLTALDDPRDRRAAYKAGVVAYVVKPTDPAELVHALNHALAQAGAEADRVAGHERANGRRSSHPRSVTLDRAQLDALGLLEDRERAELVSAAVRALDRVVGELTKDVARHDMARVAEAAHDGRGEAVALGARELGEACAALQEAARGRDLDAVRSCMGRLLAVWPATRAALARLAEDRDDG